MNLDEQLESIADEAKKTGQNDLAITLYCYVGARKAGVSSAFARHCQDWAKMAAEELKKMENRRNN